MLPDPTGKHVSQHVRLSAPGRRRPPPPAGLTRPDCRRPAHLATRSSSGPSWGLPEAFRVALLSTWSPKPHSLLCAPHSVGHSLALAPQPSQSPALLLRTHGQHPRLCRGLQAGRGPRAGGRTGREATGRAQEGL